MSCVCGFRFRPRILQAVVGEDLEGNLQRAIRVISAASTADAKVVLLPEALDVGWTSPKYSHAPPHP